MVTTAMSTGAVEALIHSDFIDDREKVDKVVARHKVSDQMHDANADLMGESRQSAEANETWRTWTCSSSCFLNAQQYYLPTNMPHFGRETERGRSSGAYLLQNQSMRVTFRLGSPTVMSKRSSLVSYNHNLTSSVATLTRRQASVTRSYVLFVL
jgi:hypothetical protein